MMSIKFKVVEKGQPGVSGGGEKKFYASANMNGEVTLTGLTRAIEKTSTVNGADIRAVLYGLVDAMQESLADGKIVRLGELGSLRVGISSNGMDTAESVKASSIKGAKVIFTPGKDIKNLLQTLSYEKM